MSQLGDKFVAAPGYLSKKFRIDQNTQKLILIRTFPLNLTSAIFYGKILTALPERISLEVLGTGSTRLSQAERVPLGKMAAFAQFGEGVIPEILDISAGTVTQYIPLVLAPIGIGLMPGDNSYCLVENMIEGVTYQVYAIQTPTTSNIAYEYLEQSVLAGDKHRKIDVGGVTNAVFPVQGLQKLVLYYSGAGTCEYTPMELQFMNAEGNDVEILSRSFLSSASQPTDYVSGSMTSEAIILRTNALDKIEVYTDGQLYEYVTIGEIDRNAR
jgi:hypothetical protein